MLYFILATALVLPAFAVRYSTTLDRHINIVNDAGVKVEVHWINPDTDELVLQSNPFVQNGASFMLNSYVGHEFQVTEMPGKSGQCRGESGSNSSECLVNYFTVNDNHDQTIFIRKELLIDHVDNQSKAMDESNNAIMSCKEEAMQKINTSDVSTVIDFLVECIEESVQKQIVDAHDEVAFHSGIRLNLAEHFENYTCYDHNLTTSEPIDSTVWSHNGTSKNVDIFHMHSSSQIHVIYDFVSPEECAAVEKAAKPILHRATVADGKGGSEYSPNRKALQAGIKIPWHLETEGNLLARVSRRVYDYTNHVLNLNIKEDGQEDLMSIQYFGTNNVNGEPDRYMPHCDGDCDGLAFKPGNRMATMVLYCEIPTKGGATNFRNAGIHVVPKRGAATFFSYINPETKIMDSGFTEHSGCPVIEGEKKIITQWIRLGVDRFNPWSSFNTLGLKIKPDDEEEYHNEPEIHVPMDSDLEENDYEDDTVDSHNDRFMVSDVSSLE